MEKRTPHHALEQIHALIRAGALHVTMGALRCADRDFGLDSPEAITPCILALRREDFYKSMTAYHDHRLWQDVYHSQIAGLPAYIKIQISQDEQAVVISFKRSDV